MRLTLIFVTSYFLLCKMGGGILPWYNFLLSFLVILLSQHLILLNCPSLFLFISSMLMLVWSRLISWACFFFICVYSFGDLMLMTLKFRSLTFLSFELQSHVLCLLVIYWIFNLIHPNHIIHLSCKCSPYCFSHSRKLQHHSSRCSGKKLWTHLWLLSFTICLTNCVRCNFKVKIFFYLTLS